MRIIGTADGYDSDTKGRKAMRIARGLVNELYLDDLREKMHRGLAGQFERGEMLGPVTIGKRWPERPDVRRPRRTRRAGDCCSCRRVSGYGCGGPIPLPETDLALLGNYAFGTALARARFGFAGFKIAASKTMGPVPAAGAKPTPAIPTWAVGIQACSALSSLCH